MGKTVDNVSDACNHTTKNVSRTAKRKASGQEGVKTRAKKVRADDWRARCIDGINAIDFVYAARVGGDVRDELDGLTDSKDMDVMVVGETYDTLEAKASLHGRVEPLETAGQKIGIRLYADWTPKEGIEIALARTEISTGDGHKDFVIAPIPPQHLQDLLDQGNTQEQAIRALVVKDLERRDFTVNAIASGTKENDLIDPYNGAQDLKDNILRTVTPHSFRDDPLRILRGFARVSKTGLMPEEHTLTQMKTYAQGIEHLSGERIHEELVKMLGGNEGPVKADNVLDSFRLARDTGALRYMLPELASTVAFDQNNPYHQLTVDEHIFHVVKAACENSTDIQVRLAALMHDSGKPESAFVAKPEPGQPARTTFSYYSNPDDPSQHAHEIVGKEKVLTMAARLRLSTEDRDGVAYLVEHHMYNADDNFTSINGKAQERRARRFLAQHGEQRAVQLMALRRCDRAGKTVDGSVSDADLGNMTAFESAMAKQIVLSNRVDKNGNRLVILSAKDLAVNGNDLKALGYKPGPAFGKVFKEVMFGTEDFEGVVDNPEGNTRENLLPWIERRLKQL